MILVLALSCFVFGCAYQYILGVPDQVAQIAGIDLSQVSLMMGVYGVCNAIGTPLLVMALTSRGPKTLLLVSLARLWRRVWPFAPPPPIYPVILTGRAVMGVGNGTFAATAYIAASRIAGPSRAPPRQYRMLRWASAHRSSSPFPPRACCVTSSPGSRRIGCFVVAACVAFVVIALIVRVPEAPFAGGEGAVAAPMGLRVFRNPRVVLPLICTTPHVRGVRLQNTYITPFMESVLPPAGWVSGSLFAFGLMEHDRLEGKRAGQPIASARLRRSSVALRFKR